jgi:hypothetical protein
MTREWPRSALPLADGSVTIWEHMVASKRIFIPVGLLGAWLGACSSAPLPDLHGFLAPDGGQAQGPSGSSGGGSSGGGSSGGSSGGCGACTSGDDGGSTGPGSPADASLPDDTAAPPPQTPDTGSLFPPFTFPEAGSSSSGGSSDGGSPCHGQNKICIDPVFDCILQGCGASSACVGAICQ